MSTTKKPGARERSTWGSFGVGLDPDVLPTDGCIPPGGRRHGVSLSTAASTEFGPEALAVIREWLEAHGSHRREQAARRARAKAEQDRQTREAETLRRQVEEELRPRVEQDVRESMERERRASEPEPLEAAMTALDRAAEYVVQLAAQLRADGHEVFQHSTCTYDGRRQGQPA
jgi:hypothetical protein